MCPGQEATATLPEKQVLSRTGGDNMLARYSVHFTRAETEGGDENSVLLLVIHKK